jgi:hypothetical protein
MLTSDNKSLNDYDKVIYLLTTAATHGTTFKTKLYKALTETKTVDGSEVNSFKYSPLFPQEYAVRVAYANTLDPALFNALLRSLKNDAGKLYNDPIFNSVYINAGAGSGKSTAIVNLLKTLIEQDAPNDITYSSITDRQTQNLKDSVGSTDVAFNKVELLSSILRGKDINEIVDRVTSRVNEGNLAAIADNTQIR